MELIEMPNIGNVMRKRLASVNITTSDKLIKLGSKKVYKRLKDLEGDTCLDTLYGLEGAIEGIRWHDLSKEKKEELKELFNSMK